MYVIYRFKISIFFTIYMTARHGGPWRYGGLEGSRGRGRPGSCERLGLGRGGAALRVPDDARLRSWTRHLVHGVSAPGDGAALPIYRKIGRASCRERV